MKKVILSVVALIVAITAVIGGYIFITSRNLQKYVVEEGVSCPYFWQELRNGTYRLKINTEKYPDCTWGVESYPGNVIAATEVSSGEGAVEFTILPLDAGQTYLQVYCELTEPFAVRVFEINMKISISDQLEIVIENTEAKEYDGITTLGDDGEYPVQWWAEPDGAVSLLITDESEGSWEAVDYQPDSMDVIGPFYRQSSCGFEIRGMQAGTHSLTLYNGATEAIRLEIAVAEDLTAEVTDFAVEAYVVDNSEEHSALESEVGKTLALPPQAAATDYYVNSGGGSVVFLLNDTQWRWQIKANSTANGIEKDIVENASEKKTAYVRGLKLTAYGFKDGVAVSWNSRNTAMVLYGEREAAIADALAVAGQIVEANYGQ